MPARRAGDPPPDKHSVLCESLCEIASERSARSLSSRCFLSHTCRFTSAAARAIVRAMRTNLLPVCRNASAAFLVLATLNLAASGGTVSLAQGPVKGPTVWDGVYTDAQAARATSVFGASCSNCHSLAPDGTGNRPLVG